MHNNKPRVIGTTEAAITKVETELNFLLPLSFRNWLIQNNGLGIKEFPFFLFLMNAMLEKLGILLSEIIMKIG
jgi:hypothetical protein